MDNTELCFLPAAEVAAAIRDRRLSPVEVVTAALERIERLNPVINAYCTVTADQALAAARQAEAAVGRNDRLGPLHGVPISIKDLIWTKGVRTTRGSRLFADFVPDEDSPVVERVKRAGAIILGKTNTSEFGFKATTDNLVFGTTRNPWDISRTPGGSSGGAGAAVAAGLGPLALGSDGGGSVRIPASFTGVFGLKPSAGRVPLYPPSPAGSLSHVGPMTRTVADAALLLDVVAGPDDRDRRSLPPAGVSYLEIVEKGAREGQAKGLQDLRVAWSADLGYAAVDAEVKELAEAAAKRFADLGCRIEAADPGFPNPRESFLILFFNGDGAMLSAQGEGWRELVDPALVAAVDRLGRFTAQDYARATFAANTVWEAMRRFLTAFDVLLTPTVAVPAFPVERVAPTEIAGQPSDSPDWLPFTYPFNLTGQPAATIPAGFTRLGLPVGLQIVGRRHDDATVLRLAAAYEAAFPWAGRRPSV